MYPLSITFVLIILSTALSAQSTSALVLSGEKITQVMFHIYDPPFVAKPIYKSIEEVENIYPEQLMSSIISATDQTWVDYNTLGGAENADKISLEVFESRKKMDVDKNYYRLISKISFEANGSKIALIKFYLYSENLPTAFSGVQVMQEVAGRWYTTSTTFTSDLALMLMRFDSGKLFLILQGEITSDSEVNNVINESMNNSKIDLNILTKIFSDWYQNNDESSLDYFIDKNAW